MINVLANLANHVAVTSSIAIQHIAKPLHELFINYFGYLKINSNLTRASLSSHSEWMKMFYLNFYGLRYTDNIKFQHDLEKSCVYVWNNFPESDKVNADLRKCLQVHHGITLAFVDQNCKEFFYFGTNKEDKLMNNFLINNIDLLNRFKYYFKSEAHDYIQEAEENAFHTPNEYSQESEKKYTKYFCVDNNKVEKFKEDTPINRFYINVSGKEIHLTRREVDCVQWIAKGKSAEETSMILGITKRTVENHIARVKQKLNVYKMTQLVFHLFSVSVIWVNEAARIFYWL